MTAKRRRLVAWDCRCERCGHKWAVIGDKPPDRCAGCKARNWNTAPQWRRPDISAKSAAKARK